MSLNLSKDLKSEVEIYDEYVELPFTPFGSDKDIIVKLYYSFKPEKVKNLINEYAAFIHTSKKEKLSLEDDELEDLLCYYIIKYFTDVTTTKSKKAKTIYNEFKLLINSRFYTQIMELFPAESIKEVQNRWMQLIEISGKMEQQLASIQKEIGNLNLENKEVFESLQNKDVKNVLN